MGKNAYASRRTVAIGHETEAKASYVTAIGPYAGVNNYAPYSTVVGARSFSQLSGTAGGYCASADSRGFAAGSYAQTGVSYGIAIGRYSYGGNSRFAIGSATQWPPITAQNSMIVGAFGRQPIADGELVLG